MRILVLSFYYPPDIGPGPLRAKSLIEELKRQDESVFIDVMTTMPNRYHSWNIDAQKLEKDNKSTDAKKCMYNRGNPRQIDNGNVDDPRQPGVRRVFTEIDRRRNANRYRCQ